MFRVHSLFSLEIIVTTFLLFLATSCFGSGTATWQGDSGRWASNDWGLLSPEGYPGDPDHFETSAKIDWPGAEVTIEDGDTIDLAHLLMITGGGVKQSGGSATFAQRLDVRGSYTLAGGALASNVTWVSNGGTVAIEGGEFVAPDGEFRFLQKEGSLVISGGQFTVRNLFLAEDETSQATVRVMGSGAGLFVTTFVLTPKGGSATAEFIFDASGISCWDVRGGSGALKLSTEGEGAHLTVDVGGFRSDGREGFPLFRFSSPNSLTGVFGQVTITHGATSLKPASEPIIKPGEYRLDLGRDGNEISVYFNNSNLPQVKESGRK